MIHISFKTISVCQVMNILDSEYDGAKGSFVLQNEFVYGNETVRILREASDLGSVFSDRRLLGFLAVPYLNFKLHYKKKETLNPWRLLTGAAIFSFFGFFGNFFFSVVMNQELVLFFRLQQN